MYPSQGPPSVQTNRKSRDMMTETSPRMVRGKWARTSRSFVAIVFTAILATGLVSGCGNDGSGTTTDRGQLLLNAQNAEQAARVIWDYWCDAGRARVYSGLRNSSDGSVYRGSNTRSSFIGCNVDGFRILVTNETGPGSMRSGLPGSRVAARGESGIVRIDGDTWSIIMHPSIRTFNWRTGWGRADLPRSLIRSMPRGLTFWGTSLRTY
jgi:hypothetical protein